LPPPIGEPHERALPGHHRRERLDVVERDGFVEADAALERAEHVVVLDPVALEERISPLSIFTGKWTMTSFFGWLKMRRMYSGSPMICEASSRYFWTTPKKSYRGGTCLIDCAMFDVDGGGAGSDSLMNRGS
jgi:hypothetical protein